MTELQYPKGFRKRKDGRLEYRWTSEGKRYSVSGHSIEDCREKEWRKRYKCGEDIPLYLRRTKYALREFSMNSYVVRYMDESGHINFYATYAESAEDAADQVLFDIGAYEVLEVFKKVKNWKRRG